jgi:menaquinone-specific isochorismate synthase
MSDGRRGDSADWAFFVKPGGEGLLGLGPFSEAEQPPADGVAFFRQDFALTEERPWRVPAVVERGSAGELAALLPQLERPRWDWEPPDAAPFAEVFHDVVQAIRRGAFEKTVPVTVERGRLLDGDPAGCAAIFLQPEPSGYGYGWVGRDGGFAGSTPELLLSLAGGRLQTMALAGTARSEEREVFEVDEKEVREHEYVAQSLVAKLTGLGKVVRLDRRVMDLGSIVHFHTPIEVEGVSAEDPGELVARLHPTPALGPLPRTGETMGMLVDWRERLGCPAEFGAPFGLWDAGRLDVVVAIRGLWWNGSRALLPAGCGVIEASRLVNEWRELRLKREAVKAVLQESGVRGQESGGRGQAASLRYAGPGESGS